MNETAPCPDCQDQGPHPLDGDGDNLRCRGCHVLFPNPFVKDLAHA